MTGYNHYPWCGCGWCDKSGISKIDRNQIKIDFSKADAERLLKGYGVTDFQSSCFVNPNAKCPVCGQGVYYYQNSFGSRVYFDDLGPPWPKHPCTDRNFQAEPLAGPSRFPPKPRPRGHKIEIVEALELLGDGPRSQTTKAGIPLTWQCLEIVEVKAANDLIEICAKTLETLEQKKVWLQVESDALELRDGDVVSACATHLSIVDLKTLTAFDVEVRWFHSSDFSDEVALSNGQKAQAATILRRKGQPAASAQSDHDSISCETVLIPTGKLNRKNKRIPRGVSIGQHPKGKILVAHEIDLKKQKRVRAKVTKKKANRKNPTAQKDVSRPADMRKMLNALKEKFQK